MPVRRALDVLMYHEIKNPVYNTLLCITGVTQGDPACHTNGDEGQVKKIPPVLKAGENFPLLVPVTGIRWENRRMAGRDPFPSWVTLRIPSSVSVRRIR